VLNQKSQIPNPKSQMTSPPFDLKERTFEFGVRVIKFVSTLPRTYISVELTRQLIRAATSVGANVEESDGAESRRDTAHKMAIARKEARESRYWLRTILAAGFVSASQIDEVNVLIREAGELVKILSAIIQKLTRE
jgi:four helix bundle protein